MPSNDQALDITKLHGQDSQAVYSAGQAERVTKTGYYVAITKKYEALVRDPHSNYNPGREYASLQIELKNSSDYSKRAGTVFTNVSWQKYTTAKGKLDAQAQAWLGLMRAVSTKATDSLSTTLEASTRFPYVVRVEETYIVPTEMVSEEHRDQVWGNGETAWIVIEPHEDDAREYYMSIDAECKSRVRFFMPLKGNEYKVTDLSTRPAFMASPSTSNSSDDDIPF